jgi:hypothetical protein
MKFKHNDNIIKNDKIYDKNQIVNDFDIIYKTVYIIDIASTSGQFYTLKNDITKMTYPAYIIDFEFDKYDKQMDRKFKILNIIKNIYK